ncbi:MAG: recombination mediator RecR [bacterium]|nr:recombination mediator RecR [bacterium]
MQKLPKVIDRLAEKFAALPGIGPRSAQRLVFYLLHNPESELEDFAAKLVALKKETCLCSICHQISDHDPCSVCEDTERDRKLLCVVEQPLDLLALERSEQYHGLYHVLHGCIDPLNHVSPDELYLADLVKRLDGVEELILATNPTMEGEATAMYITQLIKQKGLADKLKITRIGHGLPIGADIEYADGLTLMRALEGRREV